jgi:excisionase family DNA binding protein
MDVRTSAISNRNEPEERLLTVSEVARMLSLSRSKVYALVARGGLEAFKVGSSVRVPAAAVRSLLEKSRV